MEPVLLYFLILYLFHAKSRRWKFVIYDNSSQNNVVNETSYYFLFCFMSCSALLVLIAGMKIHRNLTGFNKVTIFM